jgi:hypothetical protein
MNDRKKRRAFLYVLFILFIPVLTTADQQFMEWMNKENSSFKKFQDERDAEFVKFLDSTWKEFQISSGLVSDKSPKPKSLPIAPDKPLNIPTPPEPSLESEPPVPDSTPPVFRIAPLAMPDEDKKDHKCIDFLFLETPVHLCFDPAFQINQINPITQFNKKTISEFWKSMSLTDHKDFVQNMITVKKKMKLNDWGFHFLLYKSGLEIYNGNRDISLLFVWFISSKAGYESRVGYISDEIYLLMPSKSKLYSIPFLTIKGKRYYAQYYDQPPVKFTKLFSYQGEYPGAEKLMDYGFKYAPLFTISSEKRDVRFRCNGKEYIFPIYYNKNLIQFYTYYPQTELPLYFRAAMPKETEAAMLQSLKPAIHGLSEKEAADVLLRFVQTVFAYKTDADQFGREKFMFPTETIYYPYSDCEDRSFLFAWLVENLLELETVGLDYPGHVATGVKFNKDIDGDHILMGETKYTICDPTYINAEAGMAMPDFKNIKPKIIKGG